MVYFYNLKSAVYLIPIPDKLEWSIAPSTVPKPPVKEPNPPPVNNNKQQLVRQIIFIIFNRLINQQYRRDPLL